MVYSYETFPERFKVSAEFMGIAFVVKGLGERISTISTRIDSEVYKIHEIIIRFLFPFKVTKKLLLSICVHCFRTTLNS